MITKDVHIGKPFFIHFISVQAIGNFSLEKAPLTTAPPSTTAGASEVHINVVPSKNRSRIAPQGNWHVLLKVFCRNDDQTKRYKNFFNVQKHKCEKCNVLSSQ